jgi:hypothetical protein
LRDASATGFVGRGCPTYGESYGEKAMKPIRTLAAAFMIGATLILATACQASATTPGRETPSSDATLRISEIMYNPPDRDRANGGELEFIELYNPGDDAVALEGMAFVTGVDYAFPSGASLEPDAYWVLAASAPAFQARYGFAPDGEYSGQLKNGGETLVLQDAQGATLLTQPYDDDPPWPCGADGGDFSLVLADPAAPELGSSWRISTELGGSPGGPDPAPSPDVPQILINEVLAHTDLPQVDAIEFYNPGAFDAHIGGWFLSDSRDDPLFVRLPDGLAVPAGGFTVVDEDIFGGVDGFRLSENGEEALLTAATCQGEVTGYTHAVSFGGSPNGVSLGRYVNSADRAGFPLQRALTLGEPNAGPLVGPVVISQIMYNPPADGDEYIEFTNRSDEPVPLFHPDFPRLTWRVTGVDNFDLPLDLTLPPGGKLLISPLEPDEFRTKHAIPDDVLIAGPYAGGLKNGGERIALLQPGLPNSDGTQPYYEVDAVEYSDASPWPTEPDGFGPALVRVFLDEYGDDPANWRAGDEPDAYVFLPIVHGDG